MSKLHNDSMTDIRKKLSSNDISDKYNLHDTARLTICLKVKLS